MNPSSDPFNPQQSQPEADTTPDTQSAQDAPLTSFEPDTVQPDLTPPADTQLGAPSPEVHAEAPSVTPTPEAVASDSEPEVYSPISSATPTETLAPEATVTSTPGSTPSSFSPQASTAPVEPGTPTPFSPITPPSSTKKSKKLKLLLLVGLPILLILLATGAVFGLYLPNTPGAVWNTGLERTGKALDKLIVSATEKEQLASYTASEVTGDITVKAGGQTYTGNVSSSFDADASDSSLKVTIPTDAEDLALKLAVLTDAKSDTLLPDVYFKLEGFAHLGLDSLLPGISSYDGQWIEASSEYLTSLIPAETATEMPEAVTAAEIADISRQISSITQEYVFTSNSEKAIFVQESFVGKEIVDGIGTHHYKVSIHKENANTYCKAISEAVINSSAFKKLAGDDADATALKDEANKSCDETTNGIDTSRTFDLWIDSKLKVIHKIRITDADNDKKYTDIGQTQPGNDVISLYVERVETDEDVTIRVALDINTKTNEVGAKLHAQNAGENSYDVQVTLTAKPSDKDVSVTKPTGAIPLQQVIDALGLSELTNSQQSIYDDQDIYSEEDLYYYFE